MKTLDAIHRVDPIVERVTTAVAMFSFLAILFMMVFISADVAGRLFFSRSINGCYEIVEVAMSVCVFASLAYTQAKKGHVHVTMVIAKMPGKLRLFCYALTSLITTAIIATVGYATARQAMISARTVQVTGVLHMPYSVFYGIESFCMWAFFAVLAYDTIKNFAALFCQPLAAEIQSTWS